MSTSSDRGATRDNAAPTSESAPVQDRTGTTPPPQPAPEPARTEVLDKQKERFGGIKWGSAFFGWLTATGMAVVLTALVAAVGGALGLATGATDQAGQAAQDPGTAQTAGIVAAIVALVVLLVAYYCGGYVAGRMARFNGAKQGIAVWVWAIVIVIVIAILGVVAGAQFNILDSLGGLPQLPLDPGALTIGSIIAAVAALIAALVGAVLGGLAGMRFHRKIDRTEPHPSDLDRTDSDAARTQR